MAVYTVALSKHGTTTAGAVDTINFSGNRKVGFRVQNRGADPLYYTWGDGATPSDPATDGSVDGSFYLDSGGQDTKFSINANLIVKVRSVSAAPYSVEAWTA